jgi:type I restriction enzyme S subunit
MTLTGHGHASMKRVKYQEGKFSLGSILCAVIPKDENFVLAKYLHIYLHWNREELLVSQMKGMANVSLPMNRIADVIVTVPSLDKQKEIIELEKTLVKKENEADSLFADQLKQLENLNQAILQEAVQGKLVKQGKNEEPASELLKRIKAEKAKSGKKEKPLPPIKPEDIPFEIPESWVWCRLGEVSNIVRGGSPRPAGDRTYYDGSIPFLKVGDLTNGNDVYLYKHTFTIKEAGLYKTRFVEANTLMLTNSGATLGYPKICTFPTTFNDGIAAFLDLSEDFDKVYLFYFLKSLTTWFLKEASRGQGQPNLNTDIIGFTPFPIPPKQEQKRIVAEIERQLAKTKQLKEHIIANQQATEQLLKALLYQAFEVEEMEEV